MQFCLLLILILLIEGFLRGVVNPYFLFRLYLLRMRVDYKTNFKPLLLKAFEDSKETFLEKFLWWVQGEALLQK